MKRRCISPAVLLVLSAICDSAAAAPRDAATAQARQLAQTYTPQIAALAERRELRQAIAKAADYEQELLALYPPPTYEMGLFQSAAEHLQFHCPFVDWKRAETTAEEKEAFKKLAMTGWSVLLGLEGKSNQERLLVLCVNAQRLTQRLGGQNQQLELSSDQGLQFLAQMVLGQFGTIQSQDFREIGDRRVLSVSLSGPTFGPQLRALLLPTKQRIFTFVLMCPRDGQNNGGQQIEELIRTASFDCQPEDAASIAAARDRIDRQSVESLLSVTERLAGLGEYNAAAEELTALRHLLYGRMPKATVQGNVASCPAYGITLHNPEPARWKLDTVIDGVVQAVVLEDRHSVCQAGVLIGVIDLLVTFGPQMVAMMESDDELKRQTLIGMGRGGGLMTGEVESERLVPIKGSLTYEAVVKPPMPGVKARVLFAHQGDHIVIILVFASAANFDGRLAEYDRILEQEARWGESASPQANAWSGLRAMPR